MKKQEVVLHGHRMLSIDTNEARSELRLLSPEGELELTLEVGPHGPTVRLRAVNLAIEAGGRVDITASTLALRAEEKLLLSSGGDVVVEAPRGDVRLKAQDDVALDGERILLNSPDRPPAESWEAFERRHAEEGGRAGRPSELDCAQDPAAEGRGGDDDDP
jgi:hypothetical protein